MERKIDFISLRAASRIENVPVFLVRQRPEQYVKLLHSVIPEALPMHVLITWHTHEPKSPFPRQGQHTSPIPSISSLLPDPSQLLKVWCIFFLFTFFIFTVQITLALQWSQQNYSLLSWGQQGGVWSFLNHFYMQSINSPRDELENLL